MISLDDFSSVIDTISSQSITISDIENLSETYLDFLKDNLNDFSAISSIIQEDTQPSIFLNHNTVLNSLNSIISIKSSRKGYI